MFLSVLLTSLGIVQYRENISVQMDVNFAAQTEEKDVVVRWFAFFLLFLWDKYVTKIKL